MVNPFKQFFSIFGGTGKSVLGVDVGSSSIKVVQLKKKGGRAILETYGELALGPYAKLSVGQATNLPPQKVSEALLDLMREANITTNKCGMAIPMASSMISLIEMPVLDESQLAQMIPIEARKFIPVPISEVVLDWWILPKEDERPNYMGGEGGAGTRAATTSVLLVAILNDTLNRYQEIVKSANLDCGFFEIEVFSAMRAVLDNTFLSPAMIVDIGAAVTKLAIVERGIVKVSHTINRGSQDITLAIARSTGSSIAEAEKLKRAIGLNKGEKGESITDQGFSILHYLFSEANQVMVGYEKKFNRNVGRVILSGGGAVMKGILPVGRESFQTEVELGRPFDKTEAPAFLGGILNEAGPEFSVAIGVALRRLSEGD